MLSSGLRVGASRSRKGSLRMRAFMYTFFFSIGKNILLLRGFRLGPVLGLELGHYCTRKGKLLIRGFRGGSFFQQEKQPIHSITSRFRGGSYFSVGATTY